MSKFWIILKSSYKRHIKSGTFWAMVIAPLAILAVSGAVGYFASSGTDDTTNIAVVAEDTTINDLITSQESLTVNEEIETETEATAALEAEEISGYLIVDNVDSEISAEFVHTASQSEAFSTVQLIQSLLSNYQMQIRAVESNVAPETIMQMLEPVDVTVSNLTVTEEGLIDRDEEQFMTSSIGAFIAAFAIYFLVIFYSGIVVSDIAAEKGTRVMEVILSSASPNAHFFGKITAVILVAITQLTIYAATAAIAYPFLMRIDEFASVIENVDFSAIFSSFIGFTGVFFILGLILYIIVAAFLGSLVSNVEDANKVVSPLMIFAIIGLLASTNALENPTSGFAVYSSYFPFLTPFTMPIRIAAGTVSGLELWLTLLVFVVFLAVFLIITLLFYRSNLLVYSDGDIFKSIKRSLSIVRSDRKASRNKRKIK